MTTRRKTLTLLGAGLVAPSLLISGEPERKRSRWSMIFASPDTRIPEERPDPATWTSNGITATWIGHATVLINFYGFWIITDPVFSERIGIRVLGQTVGPKRLVHAALPVERIPRPDLILLSHAHMDHLDLPSLERLPGDVPVIMAKNTADVIDDLHFRNVRELDWGEYVMIGDLRVEALPVKHFGWRFPWEDDRNTDPVSGRSFNAYLLSRNGRHVVFGGDTAMCDHFRAIGARGIAVDLACMPIGAYDPWIRNHCTPEQAVEMAAHMNARTVLPMHWGTFIQSDEPAHEPIERFDRAMAGSGLASAVRSVGQTWHTA